MTKKDDKLNSCPGRNHMTSCMQVSWRARATPPSPSTYRTKIKEERLKKKYFSEMPRPHNQLFSLPYTHIFTYR